MFITNGDLFEQGQMEFPAEQGLMVQNGDVTAAGGIVLPDATLPDDAGAAGRSMAQWGGRSLPGGANEPVTLPSFPDRPVESGGADRPVTLPSFPDRPVGPDGADRPVTLPSFPDRPVWPGPGGADYPVTLPSFPDRPVWPGSGVSHVRFLCAAADRPPINISIGRRRVINALNFGNSTPFFQERAGEHVIVCTDQRGRVVYRGTFAFGAGMAYTLALYNDNGVLQMYVVPEERCGRWGGNGCLRVVDLMEYMEPMDIFLTNVGRVFRGVKRSEVTGLRQVAAGTYRSFLTESMPCSGGFVLGDNYVSCGNVRHAVLDSAFVTIRPGILTTLYLIGRPFSTPPAQIIPLPFDIA